MRLILINNEFLIIILDVGTRHNNRVLQHLVQRFLNFLFHGTLFYVYFYRGILIIFFFSSLDILFSFNNILLQLDNYRISKLFQGLFAIKILIISYNNNVY